MKKQNNEITIKELLDLFLPRLWIIIIVSVLAAFLVGGYSKFFKEDTYTSNVSFYVKADTSSIPTSVGYDGVKSLVADYIYLLQSRTFCELVADNMKDTYGDVTASQISSAVTMQQQGSTSIVYAYVTSSSPEFSKSAADAISVLADDFISVHCDYKVSITPVDEPQLPKSPDSKNVARNALIGFAGGFVAMVLIIFLVSRFDVLVRSKEVIEKNFDIPILAVIPRLEHELINPSGDEKVVLGQYATSKNTGASQPNVVGGRVVFDKKKK